MKPVDNINVEAQEILVTPARLKLDVPMSDTANQVLTDSRQVIRDILDRKDHRVFIVVGPCSIHDVEAAMDYTPGGCGRWPMRCPTRCTW